MDQPTINHPSQGGDENSFQMPPDIAPPEPMGTEKSNTPSPGNAYQNQPAPVPPAGEKAPSPVEPHKPIFSYIVIFFLIIILIVGILLFAGWKGWIALDGLFQKTGPLPIVSASPTVSPAVSSIPTASPTNSSSPKVLSNVNDQTRKEDLGRIKNALKDYFLSYGAYPQAPNTIKTSDPTSILAQSLVPAYLQSLPDDPLAPQYYYGYKSDGQTFELTAVLEDKSDSSGTIMGSLNIYKITDSSTE